jgi:hypothetical protein
MMEFSATDIRDNSFLRQFETTYDGKLVTAEYAIQERKIFLTRLGLPDGFDDEDFLNGFLKIILAQAEERRLKVVPTFPKIAAFFRKNPRYRDLLPPGIKI